MDAQVRRQGAVKRIALILTLLGALSATVLADTLSDAEVRQQMIAENIAAYSGHFPCPYNLASNGSRCGKRSAWSKAGGYAPLRYPDDISNEAVKAWRGQHGVAQ